MSHGVDLDVSVDTNAPFSVAGACVAEREKMKIRAKAEGAKILEIPTADSAGAATPGPLGAQEIGTLTSDLHKKYTSKASKYPQESDDNIRVMLLTEDTENLERFLKTYPTLFYAATSRATDENTFEQIYKVIALKSALEQKQVQPGQAQSLLSSLVGISEERRREIRDSLTRRRKS
jgi:hypothetical protein